MERPGTAGKLMMHSGVDILQASSYPFYGKNVVRHESGASVSFALQASMCLMHGSAPYVSNRGSAMNLCAVTFKLREREFVIGCYSTPGSAILYPPSVVSPIRKIMERSMQTRSQFLLLNIAHFLDHLFMLVFATVAALALAGEWGMTYAALIPYATPGFVAFGLFAVPAGWLADRWSRHAMMVVFFVGIGLASIATSLASTPLQIGAGLFCIGVFAAIYHPVGIALVLDGPGNKGMRIAVNGVWGNLGVAVAALLTGFFIDQVGWRAAFVVPGLLSLALGVAYWLVAVRSVANVDAASPPADKATTKKSSIIVPGSIIFLRVLAVVFGTTALGGLVFQSTTFALPKVLAERAADKETAAAFVGVLAFAAFAIGSLGQLVVGYLLDRISPRRIFMSVAALQITFFAIAIGAYGTLAMVAAVGYMVAAFGQIPINDVLIGRISTPEMRSRLLAIRYTITILVMATTVPVIAWIHANYGFALLFKVLMTASLAIFILVYTLPLAIVDPEAEQEAAPA